MNVHAYELAYRLQIALHSVEASRDLCRFGAAVAGADWIDKDQISLIQPGVLIVDQFERRRRNFPFVEKFPLARPHPPNITQDQARAGPAVEGEGQRPAGPI